MYRYCRSQLVFQSVIFPICCNRGLRFKIPYRTLWDFNSFPRPVLHCQDSQEEIHSDYMYPLNDLEEMNVMLSKIVFILCI